ncbi:hypothetical protein S83_039332 [Arachis hypogaea]
MSVFSKSNPLFDVFFLIRCPSSVGFVLLEVVLSPSSWRHCLEDYTEKTNYLKYLHTNMSSPNNSFPMDPSLGPSLVLRTLVVIMVSL